MHPVYEALLAWQARQRQRRGAPAKKPVRGGFGVVSERDNVPPAGRFERRADQSAAMTVQRARQDRAGGTISVSVVPYYLPRPAGPPAPAAATRRT